VTDSTGRIVAQGSGPSVLHLTSAVTGGSYTETVSGSTRASFSLIVTASQ
jgi:hypothetical protein